MRKVKIKGVYKHFKGKYYIVEDIGIDSETLEEKVIYRALYDDNKLWIRPLNDFLSKVDKKKYPDACDEYRFTLVDLGGEHGNK